MDPFRLEVVDLGALVVLSGPLGVACSADARLALAAQVDAGEGELVLDLGRVTAVDPTGLGVLVGAHRRAGRAGRVLVLRDAPPAVRRVLQLTRLERVLRQRRSASAA